MCTNVVYQYRYGVNGKARVEKYEDSYQARIATNDFYDTRLML